MNSEQEKQTEQQITKMVEAFKNSGDIDKYRKVHEDLKSGEIEEKEANERLERYERDIKEVQSIILKTKKLLRKIKKNEKNK